MGNEKETQEDALNWDNIKGTISQKEFHVTIDANHKTFD